MKRPVSIRHLLPETKLNGQQKRQWEETLAAMNWVTPSFAHILYSMLNKRGDSQVAFFCDRFPWVGGTDGSQLIFNPLLYFKLALLQRVFIGAHEIMHCVYDHCGVGYRLRKQGVVTWQGKTLPYAHEPANCFQDYIINDGLIESRVGEWPGFGLHDKKIGTHMDSWVELYFKYVTFKKSRGGKGELLCTLSGLERDGTAPGGGNPEGDQLQEGIQPRHKDAFDQHLDPGLIDEERPADQPPRNPQEWEQAVAAAMNIGRAQGKMPAALEHMFKQVLEPKVDWRDHIRGIVHRTVGSGGYDFRKPDRRLITRDIIIPGRSGFGVDLVVLGADSSGSIYADPEVLDIWLGEAQGILEDLRPRKVFLIWCDAAIQRIDELEDASDLEWVRFKGAKGGGGTSFVPVFEWVEENHYHPDCMLYLTDLMGTFPEVAPRYPVVWGCINERKAPFGETVRIPFNPQ